MVQAAEQILKNKVAGHSTSRLLEMAVSLFNDIRDESGIVLSAVLEVLMARLPEADFVAFCAKMEEA